MMIRFTETKIYKMYIDSKKQSLSQNNHFHQNYFKGALNPFYQLIKLMFLTAYFL